MSEHEESVLYWPKGLFLWRPSARYAEGRLVEGKRHGKWMFWYKSGQRQLEGEYAKGKKTGTWIKWAENGAKVTEGEFFCDKMRGIWTDWYENGQKALESRWHMGRKDGKWTSWTADGTVKEVQTYDYRYEQDRGYSIHTNLEATEIICQIKQQNVQRHWERLVGGFVASLVKPWHIACWILIFVPTFSLINAKTPWRTAALAAGLAFVVTSILGWIVDRARSR